MEGGMGAAPDLGPGMGGDMSSDIEMGDDFGATDAAGGGGADLGREMRGESKVSRKRKVA
jgi:hypothetical protein